DTKHQLLHADADNLAETLTEDLLGPAMHFNFPQFDFRMRFEFIVEDPEKKEKIEAIKAFGPMGLKFREDEVRELTGLSAPGEGDEILGGGQQKAAPVPTGHDCKDNVEFFAGFNPSQPRNELGEWTDEEDAESDRDAEIRSNYKRLFKQIDAYCRSAAVRAI